MGTFSSQECRGQMRTQVMEEKWVLILLSNVYGNGDINFITISLLHSSMLAKSRRIKHLI